MSDCKSQSLKQSEIGISGLDNNESNEIGKHIKIPKHIEIFSKYECIYCWVEGESRRGDANQFHFNFKLYLRSCPDIFDFDIKFKTLKKLLTYVCEEKPIYFAAQNFPLTSIKRDSSFQTDMHFMGDMMVINDSIEYIDDNDKLYICKGPRAKHWWSGKMVDAQDKDMKAMANILTKLLNSPKLVIDEDNLFTAFHIHLAEDEEDYDEFVDVIKQRMKAQANTIWSIFKKPTCPEWPLGLTWTGLDIVTGIELEGIEEFEQKGYEAKECRLNNPERCWKPKMDGDAPYLIVKLDSRKTEITKLRVQGSITSLQVYKWRKSIQRFDEPAPDENKQEHKVNENEIMDININIESRKLKIIPFNENNNEITLKMEVFGPLNDNHKLLLGNALKHIQFEQLYVVMHDGNIGESNLTSHWGLKFEGKDYLLTIEWLDANRVKSTIERNTYIGQRRCWYSNHNDRKQLFTKRWGKLYMLPIVRSESEIAQYELTGISAGCIAKLIDSWIRECGKWDLMENNCQHFVRDILSLFSKHGAEYLNQFMDHIETNKAIHPLLQASDEKSGNSRLRRIRQILLDTFQQYQKEKMKQEKIPSFIPQNDNYMKNDDMIKIQQKSNVYLWLRDECKLPQYYDAFIKQGFDSLDIIRLLDEHSLQPIVHKKGHRLMILHTAKKI